MPKPPTLATYGCRNRADYKAFVGRHARLLTRIAAYEQAVSQQGETFYVPAWCSVCGKQSQLLVDYACSWVDPEGQRQRNWRERLQCVGCGLNNRMRAVFHLILGNLAVSDASRVFITEQTTPLYRFLQWNIPGLVGSEYLRDGTPRGGINSAGIRHEDITCLSFPDQSFDFICMFDVLEHVPDFSRAIIECARCLVPGGQLLLTAPFVCHYDRTLVRAVLRPDQSLQLLEPAEYHGDPICEEGVLCFYHFGWSLLEDLEAGGLFEPTLTVFWSRRYGYLGGLQSVILARRR